MRTATHQIGSNSTTPDASPVSLAGFGLSDDPADSLKWRFSAAIDPRRRTSHCVRLRQGPPHTGELHANFKISASGETVVLTDSSGHDHRPHRRPRLRRAISRMHGSAMGECVGLPAYLPRGPRTARQRSSDGPTPLSSSPRGGFFTSTQSVTLTAGDSRIYYTLDGSAPDTTSTRYTAPIPIDSTRVLRAMSAKQGYLSTRPVTQTFFINVSTNLPGGVTLRLTVRPVRSGFRYLCKLHTGLGASGTHRVLRGRQDPQAFRRTAVSTSMEFKAPTGRRNRSR